MTVLIGIRAWVGGPVQQARRRPLCGLEFDHGERMRLDAASQSSVRVEGRAGRVGLENGRGSRSQRPRGRPGKHGYFWPANGVRASVGPGYAARAGWDDGRLVRRDGVRGRACSWFEGAIREAQETRDVLRGSPGVPRVLRRTDPGGAPGTCRSTDGGRRRWLLRAPCHAASAGRRTSDGHLRLGSPNLGPTIILARAFSGTDNPFLPVTPYHCDPEDLHGVSHARECERCGN